MHHGCVAGANDGGRSGGVVADIAKLSVGQEAYYTRELATDHEQYLSGHGESSGRWYGAGAASLGLEGEASPAGTCRPSLPTSPAMTPTSCWPAPAPAGRAAPPTSSGSELGRPSGPSGLEPFPGGWPPPSASGPPLVSSAACSRPG